MGQRGPAPTPTGVLKARNSWRAKEREAAGEPQLPLKAPSCPAWLPKEGKAEWRRQAKHLLTMGVLAEIDRAALAAYCEAWAEFVAVAWAIQEKTKPVGDGGLGPLGYAAAVAEGLVNVKNKAVERMTRLAAQFGFTPSARTRIKVPQREAAADPMEAFLNGGGSEN